MGAADNESSHVLDVIVIGAGPAGAPAACYLKLLDKKTGLKVLLIEKNAPGEDYEHYHHKCGEGVSEQFFNEIAPIQASDDDITVHATIAREYWGDMHVTEIPTKECILNRPAFLQHVVETFIKAGGELRCDEVLKVGLESGLGKVTCKSGFIASARVIIAADGPNSRVRSLMNFPKPLILTVMQYLIPNEPVDDHVMSVWYSARYKGGYKYIFPYGPGKAKLGFIKGTESYHGPILEMQAKQAAIGGIPTFVSGNVVLIGSAAAFTNPFTGGGIKAGFTAARILANHLVKAAGDTTGDQRTLRMVKALKKFEVLWKNSRFFSGKYMKAYDQYKQMDDATILRLARPLITKGRARKAFAFLKNIAFWPIYRAFDNAARYS